MSDTKKPLKVVAGKFGPRAPEDLARELRDIADAIDRGEVTGLIAAFVEKDSFSFLFGASLFDSVALAALMQNRTVERVKLGDAAGS